MSFANGATVEVLQLVNIRSAPGEVGTVLASAPVGSQGTIIDGFVDADLGGQPHRWWNITWAPASGLPDGWSTESDPTAGDYLKVTMPLVKGQQACFPPNLNVNLGGTAPGPDGLTQDCAGRVAPNLLAGKTVPAPLPPGCECTMKTPESGGTLGWADTCDAPCNDPSGVCAP